MADERHEADQEVKFERPPGSSHFNYTMASALISGGAFAYYKSRRHALDVHPDLMHDFY